MDVENQHSTFLHYKKLKNTNSNIFFLSSPTTREIIQKL